MPADGRAGLRYAWCVGPNAGRLYGAPRLAPDTVQNLMSCIQGGYQAQAVPCQLPALEGACADTRTWFATALLAVPLPRGTEERYPEFCPVYVGDVMVAVLLRPFTQGDFR